MSGVSGKKVEVVKVSPRMERTADQDKPGACVGRGEGRALALPLEVSLDVPQALGSW